MSMYVPQITAVVSELSDERFRGEAVSQALDAERVERLRLTKENKELQVSLIYCIYIYNFLLIDKIRSIKRGAYIIQVLNRKCMFKLFLVF